MYQNHNKKIRTLPTDVGKKRAWGARGLAPISGAIWRTKQSGRSERSIHKELKYSQWSVFLLSYKIWIGKACCQQHSAAAQYQKLPYLLNCFNHLKECGGWCRDVSTPDFNRLHNHPQQATNVLLWPVRHSQKSWRNFRVRWQWGRVVRQNRQTQQYSQAY